MDVSTTASQTIDSDISCAACGYNLRGLQADGRCPECGAEIRRSIVAHLKRIKRAPRPLCQSDPRWLIEMAFALALLFAVAVCQALTTWLPHWWPYEWWPYFGRGGIRICMMAVTNTVSCWALWKLATGERMPEPGRSRLVRYGLRGTTIVWLMTLPAIGSADLLGESSAVVIIVAGMVGGAIASILGFLVLIRLVQGIAWTSLTTLIGVLGVVQTLLFLWLVMRGGLHLDASAFCPQPLVCDATPLVFFSNFFDDLIRGFRWRRWRLDDVCPTVMAGTVLLTIGLQIALEYQLIRSYGEAKRNRPSSSLP